MGWFNIALTCVMLSSILLSTTPWNKRRLTNNNMKFQMTISLKTFYVALALQVTVAVFLHFLVYSLGIF